MNAIRNFQLWSANGTIKYAHGGWGPVSELEPGARKSDDGRLAVDGRKLYVDISQTTGAIVLGRMEDDTPTEVDYAVDAGNDARRVWGRGSVRTLVVSLPKAGDEALGKNKAFQILEVQLS